jgi:hypothetical protein
MIFSEGFSEDSRVKIPCILHLVRLGYRATLSSRMLSGTKNNTAMDKRHRPSMDGMGAMPTLNWIGKEAVVKHHKDVPFRLLEPVSVGTLASRAFRGRLRRQSDRAGRQSARAEGAAAALRRTGEVHLH